MNRNLFDSILDQQDL